MDSKFDYFIEQTNKKLDHMNNKLDQIMALKYMVIGGAGTISLIVSIVVNITMIYLKYK